MRVSKLTLAALLVLAPAANAQTTGVVAVGTDYIARGTSQTYSGPGAVGYVEHQFKPGFYIGGIAATVDFNDGTNLELDAVAGWRTMVGQVAVELGGIYISYHGDQATNWNMMEGHVALSRRFGPVVASTFHGISPDYFNYGGRSIWNEVGLSYAPPPVPELSISGAVAYYTIKREVDYLTWNLGATYAVLPTVLLEARYIDTDWQPIGVDYMDSIFKARLVVAVKKVF